MPQDKATVLLLIDEGIIPRFIDQFGSGDVPTISRVYGKKYKLEEYVGRKIDIYPTGYANGDMATRAEDYFDNLITFVIHERYTKDLNEDNQIPDEWMDDQLLFVETQIYDTLVSVRNPFTITIGSGPNKSTFYVESAEVTVAYEFSMYEDRKVFWSEIEANFRLLKR